MKKLVLEFLRRGMIACGTGPVVLGVIYLVLRHTAAVETLPVGQVCTGIFSLTALAFIAGGMNVIYQIERLPLMAAILIHGSVLYAGYLATYLVNDWLKLGSFPILIFTVIFILSYLAVWAVIYSATRKSTERVNRMLRKKQQDAEETPR